MELKQAKAEYRNRVFRLREKMTAETADLVSRDILSRLCSLPVYQNASRIAAYLDFGKEVRTRPLIEEALRAGKEVALPKISGGKMQFYPYTADTILKTNAFGIGEPWGGDPVFWEDALMIMPGVAFDRRRNRIGYGGGYYDRYLSEHPHHFKAALAMNAQVFDEIPCGREDIRPDLIVTEYEVF